MSVVRFYRTTDDFGYFSNFSKHPLFVDGCAWPTSEHYFQARKFDDPNARSAIRKAETPMIAARLGRNSDFTIRPDWDAVKDDVMREAVSIKVHQHHDVRELLLSTGDAEIIEHTTNDSYWADGGDGSGKNMLGLILMEIRAEVRATPVDELSALPSPPWIKYHQYGDPSDMGWRMGGGEDYLGAWDAWYFGMSKRGRKRYDAVFPPHSGWERYVTREG